MQDTRVEAVVVIHSRISMTLLLLSDIAECAVPKHEFLTKRLDAMRKEGAEIVKALQETGAAVRIPEFPAKPLPGADRKYLRNFTLQNPQFTLVCLQMAPSLVFMCPR